MTGAATHIRELHQSFYDFWLENRTPDGRVEDKKIELSVLRSIAPNIVKIAKTPEGPKYTIIGTKVVEEYKQNFTGLLVSEHPHEVCRKTYLSMINQMEQQSSLINCHGYFCYPSKNYLRTMETAFALTKDAEISGYLVLVTVDHTNYDGNMYLPREPSDVIAHEVQIETQQDFDGMMKSYRQLSKDG
ncbi:hypothetical protein [Kordiimonas aquimaris]|uniref:hypothetical protein n=1 Tax=Kordiimonas aquimaris TaxID=707591 RepID=UPI0021D0E053|nr:hypothetical protein [Kordiimonas aquimaris]